MRRQKKFYAWGYADEDLSADEIAPWEAEIARRYGLAGFDVTPPPKAEEITLRAARVTAPSITRNSSRKSRSILGSVGPEASVQAVV